MKALIRNNEIMTEPFSPWVQNNIAYLTDTEKDSEGNTIKGDGWTLIDNYVPKSESETETVEDTEAETLTEDTTEDDYVVIDGVKYKKVTE